MMHKHLKFLFLSLVMQLNSYAGYLFVPLDNDFVFFDLQQNSIVHRMRYAQDPFGVRPVLSSDGQYLYYTTMLFNNRILYQRNLATQQVQDLVMPIPFNRFRLLGNNRLLLDDQTPVDLPHSDTQRLSNLYLVPISLAAEPNHFVYEEERFVVAGTTGKLVEVYFLLQEQQFLVNLLFSNEKQSWQNYYQWYLYDKNSARLQPLEGLRGQARNSGGGAFIGERPAVSYAHQLAWLN